MYKSSEQADFPKWEYWLYIILYSKSKLRHSFHHYLLHNLCGHMCVSPLPFLPQGPLGVAVTYGGDQIPKSPFNVGVAPTLDLSKISITGLGDSTFSPVIVLAPPP